MSTSGGNVRVRHSSATGTRSTHSSAGIDPQVEGQPMVLARDGEQQSAPDLAPGAVVTETFDRYAAAPQVSNRPLAPETANVVVDEDGIHISDGAIFLDDYSGNSVLTPAGFSGSWVNFISHGVYNGGFDGGVVQGVALTATSIVNDAETVADYEASLSLDVPHWVIDVCSGTATFALVEDSFNGRSLVASKSGAGVGQFSMFQDIPVGAWSEPLQAIIRAGVTQTGLVNGTLKIYITSMDITHASLGSELLLVTVTGPEDFSLTPLYLILSEIGGADPLSAYVRLRFEYNFPVTVSHTMEFNLYDVIVRPWAQNAKMLMTPASDATQGFIRDEFSSEQSELEIIIGETLAGQRDMRISAQSLILTSDEGLGGKIAFAVGNTGTPDVELSRTAANVLSIGSGDRLEGYLRFVPINRVTVFSSATTSATIARTLTGAIAGVPADAVMVSGYMTLWADSLNVSNVLLLFHTQAGSNDIGAMLQAGAPSVHNRLAQGFHVGVVQSGGAKISYSVNRSAGTLTYDLFVTGYWTDKAP